MSQFFVVVVYLYKRGTFYPFAPTGPHTRDTQLELSVRAALGADLPVEADVTRWFALWDAPVLEGLGLPATPPADQPPEQARKDQPRDHAARPGC